MTFNNILVDTTCAAGLDPANWKVPDVKISGYIIPKFFGPREAGVMARQMARTFNFETLR